MKRTILALAIAGLSFSAFALPPPGGTPGTLSVTVTNPVLPVEVSNADPIPVAVMGSTLYYHEVGATCEYTNQCIGTFPAVPAGKRLIVTNVRLVAINQPETAGFFSVGTGFGKLVMVPIQSFPAAYHGYALSSNLEVNVVYEAGTSPGLEVGVQNGTLYGEGFKFGMTGYLTDVATP